MNIENLRTFLDLIESRNFNRTAARLEISQSTVSGRIRSLEKAVGVVLFDRGRGGASPTGPGLRFEAHARQLLASWSHAQEDIGVRKGHDKMLRISAQLSLQSTFLADWAIALRANDPRLALDLQSDYSEQIMRDVGAGHADIGLLFAPQMQPDLKVRKEGEERFVMMSSHAAHLSDVNASRYYKVGYTDTFVRLHEAKLQRFSAVAISVGNEAIALELISKLGGTAYLPERYLGLKVSENLRHVSDAPVLSQPFYSVVHRNKVSEHHVSRALSALRGLVSKRASS